VTWRAWPWTRCRGRLAGAGLVRAGGRQRTDSTRVLGAIRDLNRLELAGETLRAALEALAAAAPGWLAGVIDSSWQEVYGARVDDLRLPESQARRRELMARYGKDGYWLLEQATGPGAPAWLQELPAVQALRRIWIQQFYWEVTGSRQEVRRREKLPGGDGLPPGRDCLISPYDLDARYGRQAGPRLGRVQGPLHRDLRRPWRSCRHRPGPGPGT
jgi:hypothetical protein